MKKLIGSNASPYVRRIRLMLLGEKFEFVKVNVFSDEGKKTIAKYAPTMRVPILIDGKNIVWDSLLITEYLKKDAITIRVKKELMLINEMTDSAIQLFQMRKFSIDEDDSSQFSQNNLKRIGQVLDFFETNQPIEWDLVSQWLYCSLDWFEFRKVIDWRKSHNSLTGFFSESSRRPGITETDPR